MLLIAGCGGGDGDSESVKDLLDKAFKSPIKSADVDLDVELELEGIDEIEDPIELKLTGPYSSGDGKEIPSVDWEITVGAQNQSFNAGLTSTGDRAFIAFQGTDYEISQETVQTLNEGLAETNARDDKCDLSDFGVAARDWLVGAEDEGDADVADVETTHVSGALDVGRILTDLNEVVSRASECGEQIAAQAPPPLSEEQRQDVEDVLNDPRFDVYVGKDDDTIHRLSADLEFDVPEDARERLGGLEGGRLSFSIEFSNIGEEKAIAAPEAARPVEELTSQLRGLLSGALGQAPDAGGTGGGGAPAPSSPEQQKLYEDCVATNPDDPQTRAFCEVLLQ